jgi:hypothetical protein
VTEYSDFRPDRNAVVVYSIVGPHGSGIVVLVRDPFDLYEPAEVYMQEELSSEEVSVLASLVSAEAWKTL